MDAGKGPVLGAPRAAVRRPRRAPRRARTPDTLEDVGREGAQLTLAAFLAAMSRGTAVAAAAADRSISSMMSTIVRHLADGVRVGDTSLDA